MLYDGHNLNKKEESKMILKDWKIQLVINGNAKTISHAYDCTKEEAMNQITIKNGEASILVTEIV